MSEHPFLPSAAPLPGRTSPDHGRASRATNPWATAALLTGASLALGVLPAQANAVVIYTLETKCTLQGAAPVACKVEALDAEGATLYRHSIGSTTHTLRISDQPARLSLWDGTTNRWTPLRNAAVRFSTNTLCLNDGQLCVVNPNYLNSLLQERPDFRGRDLVQARFDTKGRIDLLCYDTGCDLLAQRKGAN